MKKLEQKRPRLKKAWMHVRSVNRKSYRASIEGKHGQRNFRVEAQDPNLHVAVVRATKVLLHQLHKQKEQDLHAA